MIFGKTGGPDTVDGLFDLSNAMTIAGKSNSRIGYSISGGGDIDGDGLSELLIGAPLGSFNANQNGEAYIVYGDRNYGEGDTLNISSSSGITILEGFTNDNTFTGSSVTGVGSVDGDEFGDIIVGALGANADDSGETYLLYGSASRSASIDLSVSGNRVRILGAAADNNYGATVCGPGDVNGDGIDDLLLAADVWSQTGAVSETCAYLIYGKKDDPPFDLNQNLDLSTLLPGGAVKLTGLEVFSNGIIHGGTSVAGAGDVNGDGVSDIVVGLPTKDTDGDTNNGQAFLIYGSRSGIGDSVSGELDLSNLLLGNIPANDVNQDGSADGLGFHRPSFPWDDQSTDAYLGLSVSGAGDFNGDGFSDLLFGAWGDFLEGGVTYLVFGTDSAAFRNLGVFDFTNPDPSRFLAFNTLTPSKRSGWTVSGAGDINGDSRSDVLIGAPGAGALNDGSAYLVYGAGVDVNATYRNFMTSGVDGPAFEEVPRKGVGMIGDGSHSMPFSQVSMRFNGGSGQSSDSAPSQQTVTLYQDSIPDFSHSLWDAPELLEKANVYWKVETDRLNPNADISIESTLVFHFTDAQIANISDTTRMRVYFSKDPPSANSCWLPLPYNNDGDPNDPNDLSDLDLLSNTISVHREHAMGKVAEDFNGYYTIMFSDWVYELGEYIPPPCFDVEEKNISGVGPHENPGDTIGHSKLHWHQTSKRAYAKEDTNHTILHWKDGTGNLVSSQLIKTIWPLDFDRYQFHIAHRNDSTEPTPPIDLTEFLFSGVKKYQTAIIQHQQDDGNYSSLIQNNPDIPQLTHNFTATGEGRSLILLSTGLNILDDPIFFLRVKTVAWDDPLYLKNDVAIITEEILDTSLHDPECGSPWVYNPLTYYNGNPGYYERTAERRAIRPGGENPNGPIIAVNEDLNLTNPDTDDDMVLLYYQRSSKIIDAIVEGYNDNPHFVPMSESGQCWSWKASKYDLQWESDPRTIVIASLRGSGPLDDLSNVSLYFQNDDTQPGFNPNEEHAVILSNVVYPLRHDLNVLGSSEPYALIQYHDAAQMFASISGNGLNFKALSEGAQGDRIRVAIQPPVPDSLLHIEVEDTVESFKALVRLETDMSGNVLTTNQDLAEELNAGFTTRHAGVIANHLDFMALVPELTGTEISVKILPADPNTTLTITTDVLTNSFNVTVALAVAEDETVLTNNQELATILNTLFNNHETHPFDVVVEEGFGQDPVITSFSVLTYEFELPEVNTPLFEVTVDPGEENNPVTTDINEILYVLSRGAVEGQKMRAYRVVAETSEFTFDYEGDVGKLLQAPLPLSILNPAAGNCPNCPVPEDDNCRQEDPDPPVGTRILSGEDFLHEDHEGFFWTISANADGTDATIVMEFFYPVQPSFYFPVEPSYSHGVGECVPWLEQYAEDEGETAGEPIDVSYIVSWPDLAPELRVGMTAVTQGFGLPNIKDQCSPIIAYDQQVGIDEGEGRIFYDENGDIDGNEPKSAQLVDPIRVTAVPLDLATVLSDDPTMISEGKISDENLTSLQVTFPPLPPTLTSIPKGPAVQNVTPQGRPRLYWDSQTEELKFGGLFVEGTAGSEGRDYILPNVLTQREYDELIALSTNSAWISAINSLPLGTGLNFEPFLANTSSSVKGLSATGAGLGYVTLIFGDHKDCSGVVSVEVVQVTCPPFRGSVKVIEPDCIFDEKLTFRHSSDFGGQSDAITYEWYYQPDSNGVPPALPGVLTDGSVDPQNSNGWLQFTDLEPSDGAGALDITIGGPGLFTLSDNWFITRYQKTSDNPCTDDAGWSPFTDAQLGEGWIKRVLNGINPFEQRFDEFRFQEIDTLVSMIAQAGERFKGSVALNCSALDSFGLVEVYETVLNRGKDLSIDGLPAVDYPPANNALLLAAGRIADLYMVLGNEAYADASDPTIALGTDDAVYGAQASSIHCFMNQTSSLIEEELELLRGRDDQRAPTLNTAPIHNRLIWNFSSDITGGEVAYQLNYNIKDNPNMNPDGTIDEKDAAALYPQGHGDAWGHYLTAIKRYYDLLRHPFYTWVPRAEAVLVGGVPVTVDFLDERKFANAAAAKARAGVEIVNLTHRNAYTADPEGQWQGYIDELETPKSHLLPDLEEPRAWGLSEWGKRAGQGMFFDWVVGNAILPDVDTTGEGIQKVDRTTVIELQELPSSSDAIQQEIDGADNGLNPLGLAKNVVPFDINPVQVENLLFGLTHFEQIYERALKALNNAVVAFNHANAATQALRNQADSVANFQQTVKEKETDFTNRLIEIFGYPYPADIGPGKLYPEGYNGPDYEHFMYIDEPEITGIQAPESSEVDVVYTSYPNYDNNGNLKTDENNQVLTTEVTISYNLANDGSGFQKPATEEFDTPRRALGEIQLAASDFIQTQWRFRQALDEYNEILFMITCAADTIREKRELQADKLIIKSVTLAGKAGLETTIGLLENAKESLLNAQKCYTALSNASAESVPKNSVAGTAVGGDLAAPARAAILGTDAASQCATVIGVSGLDAAKVAAQTALTLLEGGADIALEIEDNEFDIFLDTGTFNQLLNSEVSKRNEVYALAEALQQAQARQNIALAEGVRLLDAREQFRIRTSANIQEFRYKDMGFRIFRNDAVQKYRAQFDQAVRYAYLAAKAYDYETNLDKNDPRGPGQTFLTNIVKARSIGLVSNGMPQTAGITGDPGLAHWMALMSQNWDVLKPQLGFNNPQTETNRFSLREELFRIQDDVDNDVTWQQILKQHIHPNVVEMEEFKRYCIPFTNSPNAEEPAIVIPFSTNVTFGYNFFEWPLGAGDSAYDTTKFATKIRSVGVWFDNYDNLGLSETPRVYLIPVGSDIMRTPDGSGSIRDWKILDQQIPVPFELTPGTLQTDPNYIPDIDGFQSGQTAAIRRYGQFRAFPFDPFSGVVSDEVNLDSRLIGRSVWNTKWFLIIPMGNLLNNRDDALDKFIGQADDNGNVTVPGVTDIRIFFQTYAFSGVRKNIDE